jgi:hypothetical protein
MSNTDLDLDGSGALVAVINSYEDGDHAGFTASANEFLATPGLTRWKRVIIEHMLRRVNEQKANEVEQSPKLRETFAKELYEDCALANYLFEEKENMQYKQHLEELERRKREEMLHLKGDDFIEEGNEIASSLDVVYEKMWDEKKQELVQGLLNEKARLQESSASRLEAEEFRLTTFAADNLIRSMLHWVTSCTGEMEHR